MKTLCLLVAAATIVAAPAMAAQKKAKQPAGPPPMTAAEQANDNSRRLVMDSLPVWLPTAFLPVYLKMRNDQTAAATPPAKTKKAKR